MANLLIPGPSFQISTTDTYIIGDASLQEGLVGTWCVHVVNDNSFDGTITVQSRCAGTAPFDADVPFVPINYLQVYVNGATGDQTYGDDDLTDTSLILIPATGQSIALDATVTSGSCSVYLSRSLGAAA